MHPCTPSIEVLESYKQALLGIKSRTELENKKLKAVTLQLEKIHKDAKDQKHTG